MKLHLDPSKFLSVFLILCTAFSLLMPQSVKASPSARNGGYIPALAGVTWYVATTGNDSNACTATGSPCLTINSAIGKATDGDTIMVASGTYTGSGTEVVLVNKSVTLSGGWNASFTTQSGMSTIDGQTARQGILIANITVIMDRFTIQNGFHSSQGGGINNSGTLTLSNSNISGNVSNWMGGGIYNGGILTINTTTIVNNSGGNPCCSGGGGGGGIYNFGTVNLNNSTISGNTILGSYYGSGILSQGGTMTINNSTVSGNTNADAIYNVGSMSLNNSTISNNSGIGINGGTGMIQNSTITENWSGIYGYGYTMMNSILAGNTAGDCTGTIVSSGHNLIGNNSGCTFSATTGDLVGTGANPINAGLAPLQDNGGSTFTHALMVGSPAINAGNPASPGSGGNACLATDQRGISRPVSTTCDIGAFEGQVPAILVSISGNVGIAGAKLSYMDGILKTVTANSNGDYSFQVLSGWSGTATPSKAGYTFAPTNKTYSSLVIDQTSQNYIASAVPLLLDPSFEAFTPNPYWAESSLNFGTPLCKVAVCGTGNGTAGPRTGSVWGWLGGVSAPDSEIASLLQNITIPTTAYNLQFYFWIGSVESGSNASDVFTAKIDGVTVFTANATQKGLYPSYTLVGVNIHAFADGGVHALTFSSSTTHGVNFNLDDIALSADAFADVPSNHPYYNDIQVLYANGYTGGCSTTPLLFCADTIMNRAQAAVFMLRGNFGGAFLPPSVPTHIFKDNWANALWAETWAEAMLTNGLTGGCSTSPSLLFCPYDQLTNVQAAVFGLRLKYGTAYVPPAATGTVFADLTDANFWGTQWAEQAYADGLIPSCGTSGGKPLFCPNNLVSRGFGASIIDKAKNLVMPP